MADLTPKLARIVRVALLCSAGVLVAIGFACSGSQSTTPTAPTPTTPTDAPKVTLSPASLAFTTGDAQTVTLTNSGTLPLVITGIAISGNFAETDNCIGTVEVGATCTLTVTFVPMNPGATGAVAITDNAPDTPQTLPLNGPNLTTPSAILSPANLTFASQAIGTSSSPQTVTLTNPVNGNAAPLTISSISTIGDFAIAQNTCGPLLPAGSRCTIGVTFTPTASGAQIGQLAVFDNAPNRQQGVVLNGTGQ